MPNHYDGGMMRRVAICLLGMVIVAGCATRKPSLLLERKARGPLAEMLTLAKRTNWVLEPVTQTQDKEKISVTVTVATKEYLSDFFRKRELFGEYAGQNPYFPENLVFYVKVANMSNERVRISPWEFVLVDDRGNQYSPLDVDYVDALADTRRPAQTITRGLLQEARPGYFGVSVPIGRMFAQKPQGRFALIKQCSLQTGYLYPGVMHDGLVAFWSPDQQATSMRLHVTNLKTAFDANELPQKNLEFVFPLHATNSEAR